MSYTSITAITGIELLAFSMVQISVLHHVASVVLRSFLHSQNVCEVAQVVVCALPVSIKWMLSVVGLCVIRFLSVWFGLVRQ